MIRRRSCNHLSLASLSSDHVLLSFSNGKDDLMGDLFHENHARAYWIASGQTKILSSSPSCCRFDQQIRRCRTVWPSGILRSGGDSRCNSMVVNPSFSRLLIIAVGLIGRGNQFPASAGRYFLDGATGGNHRGGADTLFLLARYFCASIHGAFGKSMACACCWRSLMDGIIIESHCRSSSL